MNSTQLLIPETLEVVVKPVDGPQRAVLLNVQCSMFLNFRFEILVPGTPKEVEFYVALEDYRDDHNNILLRKEETVVVLDRLSRPGMFKVVRLLADGSKDNEIWVPSTVLQRKKSTAEIILPAGNIWFLDKPRVTNSN